MCCVQKQPSGSDWRADLLRAVSSVFTQEQEGILAELRTYSMLHGRTSDAPALDHLHKRVTELVGAGMHVTV